MQRSRNKCAGAALNLPYGHEVAPSDEDNSLHLHRCERNLDQLDRSDQFMASWYKTGVNSVSTAFSPLVQ